jgi:hypothetical protein
VHNCGTVNQNSLNDAENSQAQGIVDRLGGHFEGQAVSNEPGIDGTYDDVLASLKEVQPGSDHARVKFLSPAL